MMLDPRVLEFREARAEASRGLSAPSGAHERYRRSLTPYVECIAEHTPPHVRKFMMEALYDESQIPLGVIAFGFAATEEELEPIRSRPPLAEEPVDEIERLAQMPYALYLKTPHWQSVRAAALKRAEGRCALCNRPDGLQVHHRSYERKGCERPADVTVLCDSCHRSHHQKAKAA